MHLIDLGEKCTIENVQELKSLILEGFAAAKDQDNHLQIDVSKLDDIDTAGVQFFVSGVKEAQKQKITVSYKGPLKDAVIETFKISGVQYGENEPDKGAPRG